MKPNLGDVIADKYRLDGVLGEGGMSTVYAAANVLTGKPVAIKWLQPEIIRDEEQSQRLLREAQATSSLDHPNVVNVFDVGRHDGALFLVMELLHGEPLSGVLQRGPQDPYEFVRLMMPVLRGVHAAHRGGVVHRDLKPDNIFICRDPHGEPREPKVLDFGISKLTDELKPGQELTREGTVFGTPQYMAPEQMRDARVADTRSDVYALGVIFYRAFSNEYPYDADTLTALAIRIVEGNAAPLRDLCPSLDGELADVVMRALALDPEQRFQSVAALGQALEPFADGVLFAPGAAERDSATHLRSSSTALRDGTHDSAPLPPTPSIRSLPPPPPPRTGAFALRDPMPSGHFSPGREAVSVQRLPSLRDSTPSAQLASAARPLPPLPPRDSAPPAVPLASMRDSAPPAAPLASMRDSAPPARPLFAHVPEGALRPRESASPVQLVPHRDSSPSARLLVHALPTTALDPNELIAEAEHAQRDSRLSIPPPPPPGVITRPSRGLEIVVEEAYTTQRVDRWSRKQSLLIGVALFSIGSIAPASWQLWQKARGANTTLAVRPPHAPVTGKTANVYATLQSNLHLTEPAKLTPPVPQSIVPSEDRARVPAAPIFAGTPEGALRPGQPASPAETAAVPANELGEVPSDELDRPRRRSAPVARPVAPATVARSEIVSAPAPERKLELGPALQSERNPYLRR